MLGKLLLAITSITYIALIAINLNKPKGTGDQMVGWGFVVVFVLTAFGICSLLLTINLASNGKFDWISASFISKFFIISVGWLCFTAGIVFITFINGDWHDSRSANWLGLILVHYGAIWIPLLMLVPYLILLNPEWQTALSVNVYKMPLLTGSIIGAAFLFLSNTQLSNLFRDKQAIANMRYEKSMMDIESEDRVNWLLYYMYKDTDFRLTQAALAKLKRIENLDSALIEILNSYESNWDYTRVYAYLENNKVEHPELFIEPLNHTISRVASELEFRLQSFSAEYDNLELLNVDGLCNILDTQFKVYKNEFRPNMLKIQEQLNKEPKPNFMEIRNRYKAAIDQWLASQ